MTDQERLNRIELPEELDQVILEAVDRGNRRKRTVLWEKVGYGCAAAAAALAILVSAGFISPVAAQAMEGIPVIGKVFTYLYDLTGYEGRYAQVAEEAEPAVSAVQDSETAGEGDHIDDGEKPAEQQEMVIAKDAGVTIIVNEYFCDKLSLYLSLTVKSETPFFESGVEENQEGSMQIFIGQETVTFGGQEAFSVGNAGLLTEGVFLDDHTFVGIARSEWRNIREENIEIPDELIYTVSTKHVKIYSENGVSDLRGDWELSMEIACRPDGIEILPVEAVGADGSRICEVRLQPYEIQVKVESKTAGMTPIGEGKMLVAFDTYGNILTSAGSTLSYREGNGEIYEFVRPENISGMTLFIVDENSWMNDWKGRLYNGEVNGPEMMEFLKENCICYTYTDI